MANYVSTGRCQPSPVVISCLSSGQRPGGAEMNKDSKPDNAALRSQVEQLRVEANMNRKKVSECTKDHLEYCESHKAQDFLVNGPSPGMENPFIEKKKCNLL